MYYTGKSICTRRTLLVGALIACLLTLASAPGAQAGVEPSLKLSEAGNGAGAAGQVPDALTLDISSKNRPKSGDDSAISAVKIHLPAGIMGNPAGWHDSGSPNVCFVPMPPDISNCKDTYPGSIVAKISGRVRIPISGKPRLCKLEIKEGYLFNLGVPDKPFDFAFESFTLDWNNYFVQQASTPVRLGAAYIAEDVPEPPCNFPRGGIHGSANTLYAFVRSGSDYGLDIEGPLLIGGLPAIIDKLTLEVYGHFNRNASQPAFLTNPTSCEPHGASVELMPYGLFKKQYQWDMTGGLEGDPTKPGMAQLPTWPYPWNDPRVWVKSPDAQLEIKGCKADNSQGDSGFNPAFKPVFDLFASKDPSDPGTTRANTPSAYDAVITLPNTTDSRSADFHSATAKLPKAVGLNPSIADPKGGDINGCSEHDLGYDIKKDPPFANTEPNYHRVSDNCDKAVLGTVTAHTPLLPRDLTGTIYLGTPALAPGHDRYPIYLVINDPGTATDPGALGIVAKIKGIATPDSDGRLTVTFDYIPPIPFDKIVLHFQGHSPGAGGDDNSGAVLANGNDCVDNGQAMGIFSPWSAESDGFLTTSTQPASGSSFSITNCPNALSPTVGFTENPGTGQEGQIQAAARPTANLSAGSTTADAPIRRLKVSMPSGLLGSLKNIAQCPDASAAALKCSGYTQIGTVTAQIGTAKTPATVDGGAIYLTPAQGANTPAGIAIVIPVHVGVFDFGPQLFKGRIDFRSDDAGLDITADIPAVIRGIPVFVRNLWVNLDRPNFLINPTNCDKKQFNSTFGSDNAITSPAIATPFQATGCDKLEFTPEVSVKVDVGGQLKANEASRKVKSKKKHSRKRKSKKKHSRERKPRAKKHKTKKPTKKHSTKTATKAYPSLSIKLTQREGEASLSETTVTLPKGLVPDIYSSAVKNACPEEQLNTGSCPPDTVIGQANAVTPLLDGSLAGPVTLVKMSSESIPRLVIDLKGLVSIRLTGKMSVGKSNLIETKLSNLPDVPLTSFKLDLYGSRRVLRATSNLCDGKTRRMKIALNGQNGSSTTDAPPLRVDGCAQPVTARSKSKCSKLKKAVHGSKRRRAKARKRYKRCLARQAGRASGKERKVGNGPYPLS